MIEGWRESDELRFWAKVAPPNERGCRLWTASTLKGGYGAFSFRKPKARVLNASRVVWQLKIGPIPDGLLVCHECDTPPCCTEDHFFLGTVLDNNLDCLLKGRHPLPGSKLSKRDVREIRLAIKDGGRDSEIALLFGVSRWTIGEIRRGETWKHLS